MTRKTRYIILFLIALCFIITAPVLILYAKGYRYDSKTHGLRKTGMIILYTLPKEANIFVNDEFKSNTSPLKLRGLIPQDYTLKIKKDGYATWQKQLQVAEGKVTWGEYIILFFNKPEINKLADNIKSFKISPDSKKIAYINQDLQNKGIWILNLDSNLPAQAGDLFPISEGNFQNLDIQKAQFDILDWTADSNKLLLSWKYDSHIDYEIVNLKNPEENIYLTGLFKIDMENLKWNSRDNNKLFFTNNNNLYQINLSDKTLSSVLTENLKEYEVLDDKIFYVYLKKDEKNAEKPVFAKMNFDGSEKQNLISDLEKSKKYKITGLDQKNISLLTDENLYSIQIQNTTYELKKINSGVKDAKWSKKTKDISQKLLYYTENEIWVYYPDKEENVLITRCSEQIKNAFWHPEYFEHIIYAVGNQVKIIELDPRNPRYTVDLYKFEKNKNYELSTDLKGENIYLKDKNNLLKIFITEID